MRAPGFTAPSPHGRPIVLSNERSAVAKAYREFAAAYAREFDGLQPERRPSRKRNARQGPISRVLASRGR